MSVLFRNVWSCLFRAGTHRSNTLRSRSFSTCLTEDLNSSESLRCSPDRRSVVYCSTFNVAKYINNAVTESSRARSPDVVMAQLMSAPTASDLLAAVQTYQPTLTHKHLLQALKCLFEMQKENVIQDDIIKDPGFDVLCQNFKKHARSLDVNEAIEATKALSFLGVSSNSLIVQTMLQLIRCNINSINIRQIMFLDFLLNKFDDKNHLVDALKLALPLAFQIQLPLQLDKKDLPLLRDMLSYSCSHDLPDKCINNIVTALLINDQVIDAQVAKSIVWSLCEVNCTEGMFPTRVQLLHICCDILTDKLDSLSYDDVLWTVAKIKGRVLEKHPEYYHEQLMDTIASYVVKNDVPFEKALLVARVLSRMAHTHIGLSEYLCEKVASDPNLLAGARTNILFGFVNCLSNNNFTPLPEKWDEIRKHISANKVLDSKSSTLPWAKFCLELASLGHYEDKLIERVFSEEYLKDYLTPDSRTVDYLQLLTLFEAVKTFNNPNVTLPADVLDRARALYPTHALTDQLEEYLARGLGSPDLLATNVALPSGIVADLMVCMKSGHPLTLPKLNKAKGEKVPYEKFDLPPGAITICIMNFNQSCFSLNSSRLRGAFRLLCDVVEGGGCACVPVNVSEWLAAPPHERAPQLLRELGYKCGQIGIKLTNY